MARLLQAGFLHLEPLELEIVAGGVPSGNEVRILDLSTEREAPQAFEDALEAFNPDIVGFTAYSSTFHMVKDLADLTKQRLPGCFVVVGGVHATLRPFDYARSSVDLVVRGEGGSRMDEIIRWRESGVPPARGEGLLCPADGGFDAKAALPIPPHPPLEEIPKPRRDLVDRGKYFCVWTAAGDRRPATVFPRVASFRTSAGCPFRCSFCAMHHVMGGKYLRMPPEDVVTELQALTEDHVYFVDDEMFADARRAAGIAELLKERGVSKHYISWARSDTIVKHPDVFRAWQDVGLDVVYVGLESMDAARLEEYDKRTSAENNKRAADILRELGIVLHAAFIVHPDFTREEFRALEGALEELAPAEFTFTVLSPSPGTEMWEAHRERYICDPFRYYDCMHTLLPTRLSLQRFYQHFGRVSALGLRMNPLRMNRVRVPVRELFRAIVSGTRYVFALYTIYKDYPPEMWQLAGDSQLETRRRQGKQDDEHC